MNNTPISTRIKNLVIGGPRSVNEKGIFHKLSLIALFAWVGLGADGLSSSCYGPQEAFLTLGSHIYLSIFVAIASALTIFVISASYSQIVELFPAGGGGYLVASRLLNPTLGMIAGCALLIDYVLTITVSIASGADAIFSLLPLSFHQYKLTFAIAIVIILMILNMRGVKESILPLVPIFLIFLATHVFIIVYASLQHSSGIPTVIAATRNDISSTLSEVGLFGMIFLVLKAYSMGAGTYTGLEAVSNGMHVLREPKVETAKSTMRYMAVSLAFIVFGLMFGYLLYGANAQPGKTLNAVFFEKATSMWGSHIAYIFIFITLVSETFLLFVGAQTGFLGGPGVLANMAKDRWFPTRFSSLSDRLVVQNGILIMGGLAAILMLATRGSVKFLVILYSINVFITFVLSQSGMVRHWWSVRDKVKNWTRKIMVNGIGLVLCGFILVSMIILKFNDGGWITLFITAALVLLAIGVKRHYLNIAKQLRRLGNLVTTVELHGQKNHKAPEAPEFDPKEKTAVLLVNGFNGMGLHTLFGVIRSFGGVFKNYVFLEVGLVDAGNFKDVEQIEILKKQVKSDLDRYVDFMNRQGYYAESMAVIGVDVVDQVTQITPEVMGRFPNAIFFGGQIVLEKDSLFAPLFHNYTVFSLQKKLYRQGIPFVILPIRV